MTAGRGGAIFQLKAKGEVGTERKTHDNSTRCVEYKMKIVLEIFSCCIGDFPDAVWRSFQLLFWEVLSRYFAFVSASSA